ncbi:hypothetical protein H8356DRAFT_1009309 [Neocallimastix lanati (nom. inval.)]|jgi:hypothetical protein|nr:hypothetical protein H8356DRAFT_1009309 [Neocallimastix sp. JGI-2020a]
MKITSLVTALLFASFTSAHTDFIPDGNRAELFEIMDHEVPDFRITLPQSEFEQMKREMNSGGGFFKRQWDWGGNNQWGGNNGGNNNPWGGNNGGNNQWGGNNGGNNNPWGGNNGGNNQWGGNNGGFGQGGFGGGGFGGGFGGGGFGFGQKENFKSKNATMIVNINGGKKSFDKVTFSIGGSSSRTYSRQAFNLKIRGKNDLYGRKQFRIRSDAREATYLRSKLACDMHNRLGIPSIAANYISLYVNEEYWGFYVLMDSPKPSWAELEYGDKDTTHIYKCKSGGINLQYSNSATQCENENEDVTDHSDWTSFLSTLDRTNSIREAESFFDVDQFLYEMAYEYLSGSWDHFLNTGHNFAMYKMPQSYGGKWTMIEYDFDADFGQDVCAIEFAGSIKSDKDYPSWSFDDWSTKKNHVLDTFIKKDRTRFNQIMKRFVEEAFNPDLLFPRIDELKDFIRSYVKKDKTPGANGKKPGMLNERANNDYTMAQWEANSEFTNIGVSSSSSGYGLKFWILLRYRKVCTDFKLNCNPEYMDLNYYYDIDRAVEGHINTQFNIFNFGQQQPDNSPKTTQSQPPKPKTTRTTSRRTTTTTRRPVPTTSNECVVASLGYACCSPGNTVVYYQDENGDWGVENDDWCGITRAEAPACWSDKLGYPCCSGCTENVYEDNDGKWGVENGDWCGIPINC